MDVEREECVVERIGDIEVARRQRRLDRTGARLLCTAARDANLGHAAVNCAREGRMFDTLLDVDLGASLRVQRHVVPVDLGVFRLDGNTSPWRKNSMIEGQLHLERAFPSREEDVARRHDRDRRGRPVEQAGEPHLGRHVVEEVQTVRRPHVERMDRRIERSVEASKDAPSSVGNVDRVDDDGRRSNLEPARRAEYPAPAHEHVPVCADRVNPHLPYVLCDHVVELHAPEVVVCVRQRRRLGPGRRERNVLEAWNRGQGGDHVGGQIGGRHPQASLDREPARPDARRMEPVTKKVPEGDVKIDAIDRDEPLFCALTAADGKPLDVDASRKNRIGALVVHPERCRVSAERVAKKLRSEQDVDPREVKDGEGRRTDGRHRDPSATNAPRDTAPAGVLHHQRQPVSCGQSEDVVQVSCRGREGRTSAGFDGPARRQRSPSAPRMNATLVQRARPIRRGRALERIPEVRNIPCSPRRRTSSARME